MHTRPALSAATEAFLSRPVPLWIDGRAVPAASGATLAVEDPATGQVIAHAACGGAEDIDRAVRAARAAFTGPWSRFTAAERERCLHRLADLIERDAQLLIELEVLDSGLPLPLAQFVVQGFVPELLRYYAGWPTKIHGATLPAAPQGKRPGESLVYTLREPIGVVGAIVPWNSPLPMAMLKLAPVLATGCTLVLKTAELTPLTGLRLAELSAEAGLPDGVVNVVTGLGAEAGAALAAHPDVDKISFTGSTEVGRSIVRAAAGNLKKVTLELGGKSPVIVFPDADLAQVVPGALQAAFFLQGQNCMAGTRLFVHEKVLDATLAGLAQGVGFFKLGHGLDPACNFGPLISAGQRERVAGFVTAGLAEGAVRVCGGAAPERAGWFYEPTILARTRNDMTPVRNEVFGPVLCVQSFGDDALEAVARDANSTIYGLSGSVWTRDLGLAHRMVRLVDSGQVSVNCHAAIDPATPFGGNRQSGWGREFGAEGLEACLKTKAVTLMW